MWTVFFACCFTLARGSARVAVSAGGTVEPLLLQVEAKRFQHKAPKATKPSCPPDGKKCTVIAVLEDGANGTAIADPYEGEATVSHLRAVGNLILAFGEHKAEECCKAYKELAHVKGVKSVEFDMPVFAINDDDSVKPADAIEQNAVNNDNANEDDEPASRITPVNKDDVDDDEPASHITPVNKDDADDNEPAPHITIMHNDNDAEKPAPRITAKAATMDGSAPATMDDEAAPPELPRSEARLTHLWPALPLIIGCVLNA